MPKTLLNLIFLFFSLCAFAQKKDVAKLNPYAHADGINTAIFSPDGKRVLTAGKDWKIKLWDARSGKLLINIHGHRDNVVSAAFNADGNKIVSASWDKTAKIWDAQSGQLVLSLDGHTNKVKFAQFSPDSKKILTASDDKTVKIWNAETGDLLLTLKGQGGGWVRLAQFSADGKTVIIADGDVSLWDAESGQLIQRWDGADTGPFGSSFPISTNGKMVVGRSNNAEGQIWDAESGKTLCELQRSVKTIKTAQFNANGTKLMATFDDIASPVRIWNTENCELLLALKGSEESQKAIFSPDEKTILTIEGKKARLWNAQTGDLLFSLVRHSDTVNDAVFSPDGTWVLTALQDGTTKIWDAQTGKLIRSLPTPGKNKKGRNL